MKEDKDWKESARRTIEDIYILNAINGNVEYYDKYKYFSISDVEKIIKSERMFSIRELEIIDWYLQEYGREKGVDKESDRLRKKISQLLKGEK